MAIGPPWVSTTSVLWTQLPQDPHGGQLSPRQAEAGLTWVVESKEQRTGDGEGQDPDDGNHDGDSALGAVACVVEHGHGHSRVPARQPGEGGPHSTTRTTRDTHSLGVDNWSSSMKPTDLPKINPPSCPQFRQ